jgi:hypothetical protein
MILTMRTFGLKVSTIRGRGFPESTGRNNMVAKVQGGAQPIPQQQPSAEAETQAPQPASVVVQKGDTLWSIAKQFAQEQSGGKTVTNGMVARALKDIKEANPNLTDAAHRGGDLIRPKEVVKLPAAAPAQGPWQGAPAGTPAPVSEAEKAAAQGQMATNAADSSAQTEAAKTALTKAFESAAQFASTNTLSPEQLGMVGEMLNRAKQLDPALLEQPNAQVLIKLLTAEMAKREAAADPDAPMPPSLESAPSAPAVDPDAPMPLSPESAPSAPAADPDAPMPLSAESAPASSAQALTAAPPNAGANLDAKGPGAPDTDATPGDE